jgi:hypothetical protein
MTSLSRKRKCGIICGIILLLLIGIAGQTVNLVRWYHMQHSGQPMEWGVSFSAPYAEYLGLDPQETLTALTAKLGVKHLRLMSYWDEIEPAQGQYDFKELDEELGIAKAGGADVVLVLGERQPRWPECHDPAWVTNLNTAKKRQNLSSFIAKTVHRYKNHNEIIEWQLENEPLNHFGACPAPDKKWLGQELRDLRALDSSRPVALTASDEMGMPVGSPRADDFGLSIYYEQWYHFGKSSGELVYPIPVWWQTLRAAVAERWLHQSVYIHELQAEPWGPKQILDMPINEQLKIYNAQTLKIIASRAQVTGIKRVYLWGGEWWYWMLMKQHDPSLWDEAGKLYR